MNEFRQFWIEHNHGDSYDAYIEPQTSKDIHVIEYAAIEQRDVRIKELIELNYHSTSAALKEDARTKELEIIEEKYQELLSYLPKVPTQTYEKDMAKKILELEQKLKIAMDALFFTDCECRDYLKYVCARCRALNEIKEAPWQTGRSNHTLSLLRGWVVNKLEDKLVLTWFIAVGLCVLWFMASCNYHYMMGNWK